MRYITPLFQNATIVVLASVFVLSCGEGPAFHGAISGAPEEDKRSAQGNATKKKSKKTGGQETKTASEETEEKSRRFYDHEMEIGSARKGNKKPVELLFLLDSSASMVDNIDKLKNSVSNLFTSLNENKINYSSRFLSLGLLNRQFDAKVSDSKMPVGMASSIKPSYDRGPLNDIYTKVKRFGQTDGVTPVQSTLDSVKTGIRSRISKKGAALANEFGFCSAFDYIQWNAHNPDKIDKGYGKDQSLHVVVLSDEDNSTKFRNFNTFTGKVENEMPMYCYREKEPRDACTMRRYDLRKEWTEYNYEKKVPMRETVYTYTVDLQEFWYDYEVETQEKHYEYDVVSHEKVYDYEVREQKKEYDYDIKIERPGRYSYDVTYDDIGPCQKLGASEESENIVRLRTDRTCARAKHYCEDPNKVLEYSCSDGQNEIIKSEDVSGDLARCRVADRFECKQYFDGQEFWVEKTRSEALAAMADYDVTCNPLGQAQEWPWKDVPADTTEPAVEMCSPYQCTAQRGGSEFLEGNQPAGCDNVTDPTARTSPQYSVTDQAAGNGLYSLDSVSKTSCPSTYEEYTLSQLTTLSDHRYCESLIDTTGLPMDVETQVVSQSVNERGLMHSQVSSQSDLDEAYFASRLNVRQMDILTLDKTVEQTAISRQESKTYATPNVPRSQIASELGIDEKYIASVQITSRDVGDATVHTHTSPDPHLTESELASALGIEKFYIEQVDKTEQKVPGGEQDHSPFYSEDGALTDGEIASRLNLPWPEYIESVSSQLVNDGKPQKESLSNPDAKLSVSEISSRLGLDGNDTATISSETERIEDVEEPAEFESTNGDLDKTQIAAKANSDPREVKSYSKTSRVVDTVEIIEEKTSYAKYPNGKDGYELASTPVRRTADEGSDLFASPPDFVRSEDINVVKLEHPEGAHKGVKCSDGSDDYYKERKVTLDAHSFDALMEEKHPLMTVTWHSVVNVDGNKCPGESGEPEEGADYKAYSGESDGIVTDICQSSFDKFMKKVGKKVKKEAETAYPIPSKFKKWTLGTIKKAGSDKPLVKGQDYRIVKGQIVFESRVVSIGDKVTVRFKN